MKITLSDDTVINLPFVGGCTGLVAKSIEITAEDVQSMINLLDAGQLRNHLVQLKHRFVSERPEPRVIPRQSDG